MVTIDQLDKYSVMQNFPNQFNAKKTIEYVLQGKNDVILRVANLIEEEAAILVHEEQVVGFQKVEFDGKNPSG